MLHQPSGASASVVRWFTAKGETISTISMNKKARYAAVTSHQTGLAVLMEVEPPRPEFVVIDRNGSVSSPKYLVTAVGLASAWLAPRSDGFVAAINDTLYILDPNGTEANRTTAGYGALARSPSFSVLSDGFASV